MHRDYLAKGTAEGAYGFISKKRLKGQIDEEVVMAIMIWPSPEYTTMSPNIKATAMEKSNTVSS